MNNKGGRFTYNGIKFGRILGSPFQNPAEEEGDKRYIDPRDIVKEELDCVTAFEIMRGRIPPPLEQLYDEEHIIRSGYNTDRSNSEDFTYFLGELD